MSFSKESEIYWKGEHVRFLNDDNSIPSIEDRVKAAFDAGMAKATKIYSNLDMIASEKCKINFPNWNE
jgi:predicted secreted protein